jgi:hypothetical protein
MNKLLAILLVVGIIWLVVTEKRSYDNRVRGEQYQMDYCSDHPSDC